MDWKTVMKNTVPDEEDILLVLENKDHKCAVLLDGEKGLPIFSISVDAEDGKSLITKKGREFISIFEKDHQRITFRLTNLTQHNVYFSLCHGKEHGKSVNKVNIIPPQCTYEVKGDYSDGEREMFLDVRKDGNGQGITVAQDEKQGPKGTYFSLKVCPTHKDHKWNNAVWTCPDFLCMPKEKLGNGFAGVDPPVYGSIAGFLSSVRFGGSAAPPSSPALSEFAAIDGGERGEDFAFGNSSKDDAFATNLRHGNVNIANARVIEAGVYFEHAAPVATFYMAVMSPDTISPFPSLTFGQRMTLMLESIYDFRVTCNTKLLESNKMVHKEEECCICMDAAPDFIFIKCGHSSVCKNCAPQLREQRCPLCRAFIEGKINL